MCVLVEGNCISDTVALQEMIATPAAKLPYDHTQRIVFCPRTTRLGGDAVNK